MVLVELSWGSVEDFLEALPIQRTQGDSGNTVSSRSKPWKPFFFPHSDFFLPIPVQT